MDPEGGDGIIKDPKNGVALVAGDGKREVEIAGQLSPMSTADGAGDAPMSHI